MAECFSVLSGLCSPSSSCPDGMDLAHHTDPQGLSSRDDAEGKPVPRAHRHQRREPGTVPFSEACLHASGASNAEGTENSGSKQY